MAPVTANGAFVNDSIRETVNALADAEVSVYPIDTAGLQVRPVLPGGMEVIADKIADNTSGHAYYKATTLSSLRRAIERKVSHATDYTRSLLQISAGGGAVCLSTSVALELKAEERTS